jgi:putative redox protein
MSENQNTIVVHGETSSLQQEITVGQHQLTADEPVPAGGTDQGPNPYDLLCAALGACTSMTLALYARRKQFSLKAVTVRLRHSKIHAEDCKTCETKAGMLDRIEREIQLEGELNNEQRQALLNIANKCPVHRTLTSEIDIQSWLA